MNLARNTGPFLFHNRTLTPIPPTGIHTIESQINVQGLGAISVEMVCVTIDLDHTFTGDLKISIVSPDNKEVVLVEREGGGGDNFRDTTFDDTASEAITAASAPFTGLFRPEGKLADFQGMSPTGSWKLIVKDQINQDGGALKSWTLAIKSNDTPQPTRPFTIEVNFLGGLTASQKAIFQIAADRWSEIIVGNLPSVNTDIGVVDDLVIDAEAIAIDGSGGTLGQAGPTSVRPGSLLPARGIMQFDSADLQRMEDDGELIDVIIHEMGHVLGIGTPMVKLGIDSGFGNEQPGIHGFKCDAGICHIEEFSQPTICANCEYWGGGNQGRTLERVCL